MLVCEANIHGIKLDDLYLYFFFAFSFSNLYITFFMSEKSSYLNLYDSLEKKTKHTISASERALVLPLESEVDGRSMKSLSEQVFALSAVVQSLTGEIPYTEEKKIAVDSQDAVAIAADGVAPVVNPVDGFGWYFKNTGSPSKINWYFYGQDANNHQTLGEVTHLYAVVRLYANVSQQSMPWVAIYTKPQGSGDASGWYHSRRNWVVPSAARAGISPGDTVLLYYGADPVAVQPGLPHVQLELDPSSSNGDDAPDQELLLVALSSDSSAPASGVELGCSHFASAIAGESVNRELV